MTTLPRRLAAATTLALALGAGALTPAGSASSAPARATTPSTAPTSFVLSSFNLLGASHTAPGGEHPDWASGAQRMVWATQLLDQHGIDVVGFQEMQQSQYDQFEKIDGATWDIFTGESMGTAAMANSIAWRRADWTAVQERTVEVPYFYGHLIRKPLVLLQNVHTGQQAWFLNTHNPSDVKGYAQKWRNRAVQVEADTVNALNAEMPDVPVFFTGDMNDREKFFCPMTSKSNLLSASGGSNVDGVCTPAKPTLIDWILGSPQVTWADYTATRDGLVSKTTDHQLVYATAQIPAPPVETAVKHVVVIDVEGLRSRAVRVAGTDGAPALNRMVAEGASTLNARTEVERTTRVPNVLGMLTGRPVDTLTGGHGYTWNRDTGSTVAAAAGRYVSSVFDLVHNFGLPTSFVSSRAQFDVVQRSWDDVNGGRDPYGDDDGRNKISAFVTADDDRASIVAALGRLRSDTPDTFSFVHLSALGHSGLTDGWTRPGYFATLKKTDALVGRVLNTVAGDPDLAASTVVVLTSDHGGAGTGTADAADTSLRGNYAVPLLVWGTGIAQGADLYRLNPAYANPLKAQPAYDAAKPPIRNGVVANLALQLLGLPQVPGSRFDADQGLVVLAPVTP